MQGQLAQEDNYLKVHTGFELELDWVSLLWKRVKRVKIGNGLKGISYLMEWWVCDLETQ